ncbi:MAG: hypothetical protein QOH59_1020 [Gemmatimonadales bacterium]|nr:hypothetical protein [Gemmatimonadales bacterium]
MQTPLPMVQAREFHGYDRGDIAPLLSSGYQADLIGQGQHLGKAGS